MKSFFDDMLLRNNVPTLMALLGSVHNLARLSRKPHDHVNNFKTTKYLSVLSHLHNMNINKGDNHWIK